MMMRFSEAPRSEQRRWAWFLILSVWFVDYGGAVAGASDPFLLTQAEAHESNASRQGRDDQRCSKEAPAACLADGLSMLEKAESSDDYREAQEVLAQACTWGSASACNRAAFLLLQSQETGIDADVPTAKKLLRSGCQRGHAESCTQLGHLYMEDLPDSPAEPGRALQYYGRACKAGDPAGCMQAGISFQTGQGAPVDIAQATRLLNRSCDAAYGLGCFALASLYRQGNPSDANLADAFRAINRACELKVGAACAEAGIALEQGKGAEANPQQAREAYRFGCSLRDGRSCGLFAFSLERGVGGEKDRERAHELYEISCAAGHQNACIKYDFFELGDCPEGSAATVVTTTYACRRPDETLHGPSRTVYTPGKLQSRGEYDEGTKDGAWTYFYPTGEKQAEETYEKGDRQGIARTWYKNGELQSETTYVDDRVEGYARVFFSSGDKKIEELHEDGKGTYTQWHQSGSVAVRGELDGEKRVGHWVYTDPEGAILHDNALGARGNGRFTGYTNGHKSESGRYRNGLKHGLWKSYGAQGNVTRQTQFVHGEATGAFQTFYDNAKTREKGTLKNGLRHGAFKEYHPNEQLRFQSRYRENRLVGPAQEYDQKGRILRRVDFPQAAPKQGPIAPYTDSVGIRHGQYFFYHPNGTKAREEVWELGELISAQRWSARGEPMSFP